MTFTTIPALIALLLTPATVPAMTENPHALSLDVRQQVGGIEVLLIGNSAHAQQVSYQLEVTGQSTSRHRGTTTLAAGATAILSTIRASTGSESGANSGADWCVRLLAEEEGRAPYEVIAGNCSTDPGADPD